MGKRESKNKEENKSKSDQKQDKKSNDRPENEEDFGGIPKRDLKRNLGCG
ncbi:MAG: hypothetical protein RLN86_01910 [Cyclobacteriaceae bacterium]